MPYLLGSFKIGQKCVLSHVPYIQLSYERILVGWIDFNASKYSIGHLSVVCFKSNIWIFHNLTCINRGSINTAPLQSRDKYSNKALNKNIQIKILFQY